MFGGVTYAVEQQKMLLKVIIAAGPQLTYLASQQACVLYSAFSSSRRCLLHVEPVTVA
jgi:hypothetical protein